MQGHSPLGASGAERWMNCPGSVGLSVGVNDEEDDTFSRPGTAAHSLGELCLTGRFEAWQYVGQELEGIPVDKEMADAVQFYLDEVRRCHPERNQGDTWIERRFHCPSIHELFYGTSDLTHVDLGWGILHVWDFKYGAGIVVDVKENPQLMYYACGMLTELELWDTVETVVLHICQPRGFHHDGQHREWSISTVDLSVWLFSVLVPAMERALVSRDTASGDHCRFCPVRRRACPQLLSDVEEVGAIMAKMEKKGGARELTNDELARFFELKLSSRIAFKAAEETIFARLQAGQAIPGTKLASAKANREWKDDAEAALTEQYKDRAFERKLKSPAQIEKLPEGEKFTARYAFKPDAGLVVVPAGDSRVAASKDTKSMFEAATKKRKGK